MPRIHRAEFLSYYNARRNSDKLFNVFLIEDDDGTFRCVSEYGRRGNNLVRDTLCAKQRRETAESHLRQKLSAKRNHRETPYTDEPFGFNYSPLAREYNFTSAQSSFILPAETNQAAANGKISEPKRNIIAFPAEKTAKPRQKPKPTGILNQEQFDSLEI
jgi:hypothetical protein